MPLISMFFGIIIQMYFFDTKQHHLPHFHAKYQDFSIIIAIESSEILEGELPPAKLKLVLAWLEIHREDLLADWNLAVQGQQVFQIDPLR
jgi:hypothetical protein